MERKNQLINLKIILDSAIKTLSEKDKKILYIKMHYKITMLELCGILEIKERTAFRMIERAYENLTHALNNSKYVHKLVNLLNKEDWLQAVKEDVKERRMAYKNKECCASIL